MKQLVDSVSSKKTFIMDQCCYIIAMLDKFDSISMVSAHTADASLLCSGRNEEKVEGRLQKMAQCFPEATTHSSNSAFQKAK